MVLVNFPIDGCLSLLVLCTVNFLVGDCGVDALCVVSIFSWEGLKEIILRGRWYRAFRPCEESRKLLASPCPL